MLTYNEQDLWIKHYPKDFVDSQIKPHNFHFIVLDNGNQPLMKQWCEENNFTYYASEYNIGSSGGYNWAFKVAYSMNLDTALFMQADVEINNAEPLLLTYNLTKEDKGKNFFIWPQTMWGYWEENPVPWVGKRLHNLGNLVGFNSLAQFEHQCYFDENYVVTHFDDLEFIWWLETTNKKMCIKNVPEILNHSDHSYEKGHGSTFIINGSNYIFKVHHASQTIHEQLTGEFQFHNKWLEFNQPYYREAVKPDCVIRLPYDPSRWTRFGYPPYPVLYEINRFFDQQPELKVNSLKHWKIPNE
jgi:hypothetical protein